MTEIYLVRHCEAMGNKERIFQGVSDCAITELGRKQLVFLAERFRNILLDAIYSSPLTRAVQTAEAVGKYHSLPINIHPKLIEIDGGEIEGISWVDFPETRPELEYYWSVEPHKFYPKNGEPMTSVYERSWEAVEEILATNKGKTVVLASHGCTLRNILCHAQGKPIEELSSVHWCDNTGVSCLRFGDDPLPEIVLFNDVSHLPDGYLPRHHRITTLVTEKKKEN